MIACCWIDKRSEPRRSPRTRIRSGTRERGYALEAMPSHRLAKVGVVKNEITLSAVQDGIEPAPHRDALAAGRERTVRSTTHAGRARPESQHHSNKGRVLIEGELRHESRAAVDAPGMDHLAERSRDSDRAADKLLRTCAQLIQLEHARRVASRRRDWLRFRIARDSSGPRRTAREQRDHDELHDCASSASVSITSGRRNYFGQVFEYSCSSHKISPKSSARSRPTHSGIVTLAPRLLGPDNLTSEALTHSTTDRDVTRALRSRLHEFAML